jgi:hypothetical protein
MLAAIATALVAAMPIPQGPSSAPGFIGHPAVQRPLAAPPIPQHPHMAPNGSSLLHEDGWQTDASTRAGPLGDDPTVTSTFFARDCASVTFDSRGRIVTVCVGLDRPQAVILDPRTLDTIDSYDLPPRDPLTAGNPLTSFGGGGYFYLDEHDTAHVPTTARHVVTLHAGDTLEATGDIDLSAAVKQGDSIISALPDWSGRLWFASRDGVFGTEAGHVQLEPIGNSFAVAEHAVYVVTDAALYKFTAAADGTPVQRWRVPYPNVGTTKPGQTQAGSGTTPTLMARNLVAITDNADPMNVRVYTRAGREKCSAPVFEAGASATDQSLIAVGRSLVAENNFGYSGPAATELGRTTTPGLARVDVSPDLKRCTVRWTSKETAPSVVPKVSLPNGLLYTYTKPEGGGDPWYFTALDFRTGETVFKTLTGDGLGFNNHYAPVTIGPDGTAYVGTLGGLIAVRDAKPPPQPTGKPRPRLHVVRCKRRVAGRDTDWIRRVRFGRRVARITLTDGTVVRRRIPPCASRSNPGRAATGG